MPDPEDFFNPSPWRTPAEKWTLALEIAWRVTLIAAMIVLGWQWWLS